MKERSAHRAHILVVDRSLSFGRLLRSQLKTFGYKHIHLAASTAEAIESLVSSHFDAVLCDTETGPIPASVFARAARRRPDAVDPFVSLIMLSFVPTWRTIAACRDAGANSFLMKPVSAAQLEEKLAVALTGRRRFIEAPTYFGPDRRRTNRLLFTLYCGPERRDGGVADVQAIPAARFRAA